MSQLDSILDGMNKWNTGQLNPPKVKQLYKQSPKSNHSTSQPDKKRKLSSNNSSIKNTNPFTLGDEEQENDGNTPVLELGDAPIISTVAQCDTAIKEISAHKVIAVDCEGVNLGREGRLCLVQIATANKSYLFDVVEGGKDLFQHGLRKLLEDSSIMKVMHDCRLDSDALFHEHQVTLQCVYDTQIGFAIVERQQHGATPLPVGLNTLLRRFGMGATNEAKDVMKEEMQRDCGFWGKRPMSDIALQYARQDVIYLCLVQRQMDAILSKTSRSNLLKYSDNYLAQYRNCTTVVRHKQNEEGKNDDLAQERFVPQYGIKAWDDETALSLERSTSRSNRRK